MTKAEFIKELAAKTEQSTAEAEKFLKAFIATITETLAKGDSLRIVNFISFSTSKRAARKGMNPQTGKKINIPASTVAKFKAGKGLKTAVNGG